jgi:hypothetical protein
MDEALLDARIEAAEARTDTKFAQLIGKIDSLQTQIEHLDDKVGTAASYNRTMKWQLILAILGAVVALGAAGYSAVGVALGGMGVTENAFQAGMVAAQKPAK